jgi:hypothetical protein
MLYEKHGIHRNQIPSFFPSELTIADVQSESTLSPKLTDEVLERASSMFAINKDWLSMCSDQVYQYHDCYKHSEEFEKILSSLQSEWLGIKNAFLVIKESDRGEKSALIIFKVNFSFIGRHEVSKYIVFNNWNYDYWKARVYLGSCLAIALSQSVSTRYANLEKIGTKELLSGEAFFTDEDGDFLGWKNVGGYPEDILYSPMKLLEGIGTKDWREAITLYLKLHRKGLLPDIDVQPFIDKLDELKVKPIND